MVQRNDFIKRESYLFEIPRSFREDMRVPARVFTSDSLLKQALGDRSLDQLINTATLPGIVGYALAMPDMHQGYGFPIGGVAATDVSDGVISPGGVGYDINCGVRLLTTGITAEDLRPHLERLMDTLFSNVPTGVGSSGAYRVSPRDMDDLLTQGAGWLIQEGYATADDLRHTEDGGCMSSADPAAVSKRAKQRGLDQLGTLGAGNHFLEVDEIVEVYDDAVAEAFDLHVGDACVWIHCGSRGLGHQVCSDAVRDLQGSVDRYGIELPDRQLVCAPFDSVEGQQYYRAMCCAANYAWANRQVITHLVRRSFDQALAGRLTYNLQVLYDVCHNIAKVEEHPVDGQTRRLCVHRKGATRAFGPTRPQVPEVFRDVGQPVLIPGDMRTGSYVLVGTEEAMQASFGSTCHGAGRVMSRTRARKSIRGEKLRADLEQRDSISVRAHSMKVFAEEAPFAYKKLDEVVDVVHRAGLSRRVARTRPMGVIKG